MPAKKTAQKAKNSHVNISLAAPKQQVQNKLAFEVILFDELCKQFEKIKGWQRPKQNPFLERTVTPFSAIFTVKEEELGCEVIKESDTTKLALLSSDKHSLEALSKCIAAYDTTFKKWKNVGKDNEKAKLTFSLTVNDVAEIKTIFEALDGVCYFNDVFIRDAEDHNKTKPISAERIEEIRDQIKKEKLKAQPDASKDPKHATHKATTKSTKKPAAAPVAEPEVRRSSRVRANKS